MRGQLRRLASRRDRLDNLGRQEGGLQDPAEVAIADPFAGDEPGEAAGLTRKKRCKTAMRRQWTAAIEYHDVISGWTLAGGPDRPTPEQLRYSSERPGRSTRAAGTTFPKIGASGAGLIR